MTEPEFRNLFISQLETAYCKLPFRGSADPFQLKREREMEILRYYKTLHSFTAEQLQYSLDEISNTHIYNSPPQPAAFRKLIVDKIEKELPNTSTIRNAAVDEDEEEGSLAEWQQMMKQLKGEAE